MVGEKCTRDIVGQPRSIDSDFRKRNFLETRLIDPVTPVSRLPAGLCPIVTGYLDIIVPNTTYYYYYITTGTV